MNIFKSIWHTHCFHTTQPRVELHGQFPSYHIKRWECCECNKVVEKDPFDAFG